MAKRIKFNLILDNTPVRDLEGLRDNFNLDDLLSYFKSGVFQRWLEVRGYREELQKVERIDKGLSIDEVARKLINIFLPDAVPTSKEIYHLHFLEERREFLETIERNETHYKTIVQDYHDRYEELKQRLIQNCENLQFLLAGISEIENQFLPLFQLEATKLLNFYGENHILIAVAFLLNRNLRKYILEDKEIKSKLSNIIQIRDRQIKEIYNQFKSFRGLDEKYKSKVKTYQGDTSQKWIRIEEDDVLILQSNAGTKLRDIYEPEQEYSHVYAKGSILRGLEFHSFKSSHFVKYIQLKDIEGFIGAISIFRGVTDGYWKDIETADTECLILQIGEGCYIRSLGKHGEELSANDVNGEFPLLQGIDYKSNSKSETLYYIKISQ